MDWKGRGGRGGRRGVCMRVGGGVVSALVAPHKESGLRVSGVAGLSHGVRFASRADQKIRSKNDQQRRLLFALQDESQANTVRASAMPKRKRARRFFLAENITKK